MRATVKLVVVLPSTREEQIVASHDTSSFHPESLDTLIPQCLLSGVTQLRLTRLSELKAYRPEVSVHVWTEGDESERPALHLSGATIACLAEAGADLDFDPYV